MTDSNIRTRNKINALFAVCAQLVKSGEDLPAELNAELARIIDEFPLIDVPAELMSLVNTEPAFVSPAENNAITINELLDELVTLDNAHPDFDNIAELISDTLNEVFAELMNLAGIETGSSDSSAEFIGKTVKELVTEMVTLKKAGSDVGKNSEASVVTATNINFGNIAETIEIIIADFIETNKEGIENQLIKGMSNAELVSFT